MGINSTALRLFKTLKQAKQLVSNNRTANTRVTYRYVKANFDTQMDKFARLRYLEGMFGKAPGTWTSGAGNMDRMLAKAGDQIDKMLGGKYDVEESVFDQNDSKGWFSKSNTGFFTSVANVAEGVLKSSGRGSVDADDLIQSLTTGTDLYGMSLSTTFGDGGIFYYTGQKVGKKYMQSFAWGTAKPYDAAVSVRQFTKNKALQLLKNLDKDIDAPMVGEESSVDDGEYDSPFQEHRMALIDVIMSPTSREAKTILNYLKGQQWYREGSPKGDFVPYVFDALLSGDRFTSIGDIVTAARWQQRQDGKEVLPDKRGYEVLKRIADKGQSILKNAPRNVQQALDRIKDDLDTAKQLGYGNIRMGSKKNLAKAVMQMQKYLGAVDRAPFKTQERLHNQITRTVSQVADSLGMSPEDVWSQVETQARKKGITPGMPGKDW